MNTLKRKAVLAALWDIKKGNTKPVMGLCTYLSNQLSRGSFNPQLVNWLGTKFVSWPEYSGDYNYPVPSPYKRVSAQMYYEHNSKWEGAYGSSRMRLVNFLIRELEKELADA
jgi:hypothetical protein